MNRVLLSLAICVTFLQTSRDASGATELGIRGSHFTLNGVPTFLLGMSYYGGLGAPEEFIVKDVDDLQRLGFNWVRVWATWAAFDPDVSAVDSKGLPREPYLGKLAWLIAECDRRRMVVDVTLSRGKAGTPGHLESFEGHQQAVKSLVAALKNYRNWYLDLANERDVGDARYVAPKELKALRVMIRQLDPSRLVTASLGGHDVSAQEIRAIVELELDFVSVHRPRDAGSPLETEAKTRESLAWMTKMQRETPLHYQEPFRRGYGSWEPAAADFITDLQGARRGGAAGWCFHNGAQRSALENAPRRSFDLGTKRLFDQLEEEEQKVAVQAVRSLAEP